MFLFLAIGVRAAAKLLPRCDSRFSTAILQSATEVGVDYYPLATVASSDYSCLLPHFMSQVRAVWAREFPAAPAVARIVDAMANIGCDTVLFRDMFPSAHIDAVELDAAALACLKKNMAPGVLSAVLRRRLCSTGSVTAHGGSCVTFLEELAANSQVADVVFFDPPWGGPNYYKHGKILMRVDNGPLGSLVGQLLRDNVARVVAVKAPANADMDDLQATITASLGHVAKMTQHDILRPVANVKGKIGYRLCFFRP